MNFPSYFFSSGLLYGSLFLVVLLMGWAAIRLPWRGLSALPVNAWMASAVLVMALWMMRGGLKPGLSFHILGMGVLSLMMGPTLVMLLVPMMMLILVWGGVLDEKAWAVNVLVSVMIPVLLMQAGLSLSRRYLPHHLFVYVFVNAFLCGGLTMFVSAGAGVLLLGGVHAYEWDYLVNEALPYYFLFSWAEAFLSGLMVVVLVVYRPHWIFTFDDKDYLGPHPM